MDRLTAWLTSNTRWIKRQLVRRGSTREQAEDLIQEAYLRVHEYCERNLAREPEKVLMRTVQHLSFNAHRDQSRHPYLDKTIEEMTLTDPAPSPEEALLAKQRLKGVVDILETIDDRAREAFLLHRMDGFTYAQIAKQMGISVSMVEKHIAWAMAVLLDATGREERQ